MSDPFAAARQRFESILDYLAGPAAAEATHADLEEELASKGRELLRQLFQDHLDLRSAREDRLSEVTDAAGLARRYAEAGHSRRLVSVFGELTVSRLAYRRKGHANLHPADAALNLPVETHSHGIRRLAAAEAARGSFADATAAVADTSGVPTGKRQVEALAVRAAADFEDFYQRAPRPPAGNGEVVVISVDGKGVVMRPDALRGPTANAAAKANPKLARRRSKGEKGNRKRMATVGAVHTVTPVPRAAVDVVSGGDGAAPAGPVATDKWLTASVVEDASAVVARVFDEADRRDPGHQRTWVALVDGNNHQIDRITAEAARRKVSVHIVLDVIHVIEYLWSAAWCFFAEGDPAAEEWVAAKLLVILEGDSSTVAASIRRKATCLGLEPGARANADRACDYLLAKRPYLDYPMALREGWPIATGVIEGACRHIVKDRMDITGARWGLDGAEAVLRLRALRANGDFEGYWTYHLQQEHRRVHLSLYRDGEVPLAA